MHFLCLSLSLIDGIIQAMYDIDHVKKTRIYFAI